MKVVTDIIKDIDMHIFVHNNYGKGFMKKCKLSSYGYIQISHIDLFCYSKMYQNRLLVNLLLSFSFN